jgi:hypothetical protein
MHNGRLVKVEAGRRCCNILTSLEYYKDADSMAICCLIIHLRESPVRGALSAMKKSKLQSSNCTRALKPLNL